MGFFLELPTPLQALVATFFTWAATALGAAVVFTSRTPSRRFLDVMLGFAAGVMIAASFWSLLDPALEMAQELGWPKWLPVGIGFMAGGVFLRLVDRFMPHMHLGAAAPEGLPSMLRRTVLLVLAITLHNIPEGLAVGVAFGAVGYNLPSASLTGAIALAAGMAIQNFPEGMAVSLPLRREGLSAWKSFVYGQYSGLVEPVFGVLGAMLVGIARPVLPFALAFAAGAMIFVVVEEVIPESQSDGYGDDATMGVMVGFVIMMILDTALG